jgi:hypothetical protein
MVQPLFRIFVPFTLNGYLNRYPSPMHVSETVHVCSYQLFATKRKMQGSKCIYLNGSKLLKIITDKNKINIIFSYSFLN